MRGSDEFVDLKGVIEKLKRDFRLSEKEKEIAALRRWPELAGERLAKNARPLWIKNGILYVEADGAAWRQEIAFQAGRIVEALNREMGGPKIREIKYRDPER